MAVSEWFPKVNVVDSAAAPPDTGTLPSELAPSKKATVPAAANGDIDAMSMTLWPATAGLGDAVICVVVAVLEGPVTCTVPLAVRLWHELPLICWTDTTTVKLPDAVSRLAGTVTSISPAAALLMAREVPFQVTVSADPEHGADELPANPLPRMRTAVAELPAGIVLGVI